jgi:hypothetical protein
MEQSSERALDAAEIDTLGKRIRTLRMRPILTLGLAVLLISVIVLLLSSMHWESKAIDALVSAFGISLIFLGLPLWILFLRDSLRDAKTLKNDIEIGRAFVFEGQVAESLRHLKIMRGLIKARLIYYEENSRQRFDILPSSGTVIGANGKMPGVWCKEKIFEATAPPEQQYEALVNPGISETNSGQEMDLYQRHMSQDEYAEITTRTAKLRRPPGFLILMAVWMLILAAAFAMHASSGQIELWIDRHGLQAVLVCFITAIAAVRYFRMLKMASLLSREAGMKVLMVLRPRSGFEVCDDKNIPPILEYLPISQLGWSSCGKPYPWRLRKMRISKAKAAC